MTDLSAEDQKLVTLARATRARTRAAEGAAVRDADGRTYAAATVDLPSLRVSALGVCVAMAVASGAKGLEAAVVLTEGTAVDPADLAALSDFGGGGIVVHRGDPKGAVVETLTSEARTSADDPSPRILAVETRATRRCPSACRAGFTGYPVKPAQAEAISMSAVTSRPTRAGLKCERHSAGVSSLA